MRSLSDIRARTPKSEIFRGQIQHAYIWVHMYGTEAPDMRILYRDIA